MPQSQPTKETLPQDRVSVIVDELCCNFYFPKGFDLRTNPLDPEALEYLRKGGIKRVIVGHTPSGSSAAVLHNSDGFEVISADTNYAAKDGRRGSSWLEVTVEKDGRCRLRGHTGDEDKNCAGEFDCFVSDEHIGQVVEKDWWCKVCTSCCFLRFFFNAFIQKVAIQRRKLPSFKRLRKRCRIQSGKVN